MFEETQLNTETWVQEPIYKSVKAYVEAKGVEYCKELILRHVVKGKYEVKDIPRGTSDDDASGVIFTSAFGSTFRVFSFREPYEKVPEAGAVVLYIKGGMNMSTSIDVASTDIEPTNGIVHSLAYGFTWGQL
jgi:fasciclin domain protein